MPAMAGWIPQVVTRTTLECKLLQHLGVCTYCRMRQSGLLCKHVVCLFHDFNCSAPLVRPLPSISAGSSKQLACPGKLAQSDDLLGGPAPHLDTGWATSVHVCAPPNHAVGSS